MMIAPAPAKPGTCLVYDNRLHAFRLETEREALQRMIKSLRFEQRSLKRAREERIKRQADVVG